MPATSRIAQGLGSIYVLQIANDGNFLMAKRVLGNPQPENRTLGALIVDSQQADVLAKALATVKQEFELERQESLILENMIEAVEQLLHITPNAKFEAVK